MKSFDQFLWLLATIRDPRRAEGKLYQPERLSMRHIREVLRLHYSVGMSQRTVARNLGLAQGTVSKYLNRTRRAGVTWPLPPELDDDVRLENRL